MKKVFIITAVVFLFALTVVPALATTINATSAGLYYGDSSGLGTKDVREGVMAIVQILLGFLGVIAIVIVLYGGFTWMVAGGNEEKVGEAKKIIGAGIIGLVIIFTSYAIATFIVEGLVTATI